jgi:hypothetical protein
MDVQFIASVSMIAPDPPESQKLHVEALGLPLEGNEGDYVFSAQIPVRSFVRRPGPIRGTLRPARGRRTGS